jgi:uncharacterized membrane protein YdjX (TVP38/TMEM64 family)
MKDKIHIIIQLLPILGIGSLIWLFLYGIHLGIFDTANSLVSFIGQFGRYGVALFISIQIVQVIVPIIPGGISTVVGMMMFGDYRGFLYSYIGLVIGEIIADHLVRHYGHGFVKMILSKKNYEKFENLIERNQAKIRTLLVLTFIIPFAPDDLACFVAGFSRVKFKDYLLIIMTLKPISIAIYSYLILHVVHLFIK